MIKSLLAATAFAALALSTAAASEAKDHPAASPSAEAAAPATATSPNARQKYCIVQTSTGSRIPRKTCKTRSEWQKQGFDPLNP